MTNVAKVVTIIGQSPDGFAETSNAAVQEACRTLRGMTAATVN